MPELIWYVHNMDAANAKQSSATSKLESNTSTLIVL